MPTAAKVRNMMARAAQSADLCFNMSGVITRRNFDFATGNGPAFLGQSVSALDIEAQLYDKLGETVPQSGPIQADARLKYGQEEINKALSGNAISTPAPYIFAIRNEAVGAALNQAIEKRENTFLERYMHVAEIKVRLTYSYTEIVSHLTELTKLTKNKFDKLDAAYSADGIDVQKSMETTQTTDAGYRVKTENTTKSTTLATWNTTMETDTPSGAAIVTEVKDGGGTLVQTHAMPNSASVPLVFNQGNQKWEAVNSDDFVSQVMSSETTSDGAQITRTKELKYTHPPLENEIEYRQSNQGIHGELIKQELASYRLPHIERIMENELKAIDLEIRSLQLNYAHTFLTSPFDGVVTAIYKDYGESVEAGEPVLRVEDDTNLLLVLQAQVKGAVRVDMPVSLTFSLVDAGSTVTATGKVVSVRGHEADNDEWDLILSIKNPLDANNNKIIPLNYQFDADSTQLQVG